MSDLVDLLALCRVKDLSRSFVARDLAMLPHP
jgi:hypothetical protein